MSYYYEKKSIPVGDRPGGKDKIVWLVKFAVAGEDGYPSTLWSVEKDSEEEAAAWVSYLNGGSHPRVALAFARFEPQDQTDFNFKNVYTSKYEAKKFRVSGPLQTEFYLSNLDGVFSHPSRGAFVSPSKERYWHVSCMFKGYSSVDDDSYLIRSFKIELPNQPKKHHIIDTVTDYYNNAYGVVILGMFEFEIESDYYEWKIDH